MGTRFVQSGKMLPVGLPDGAVSEEKTIPNGSAVAFTAVSTAGLYELSAAFDGVVRGRINATATATSPVWGGSATIPLIRAFRLAAGDVVQCYGVGATGKATLSLIT